MGRITETISTVNSAIRTLLVSITLFFVGGTGYYAYDTVTKEQRALGQAKRDLKVAGEQIRQLELDLDGATKKIDHLEVSLKLIKTDQRLARLDIIDQKEAADPESGTLYTKVRFSELTPEGDPIGTAREFTITGDVIYIASWVVKFKDQFIEQANLERGTSLTLFRRIFGEHQNPAEGFALDTVGGTPQAYRRGGKPSEFEQKIWSQFWTFANDREKAQEMGIRAAHGDAPFVKAKKGMSYKISLRASDGLSITPMENNEQLGNP